MDAWLNQMGFPLVTVVNGGGGTATVTAERYFNPRGQTPDITSDYNYEWNIAITVATVDTEDWTNIRPSTYLNIGENSQPQTLTGLPTSGWFVLNPNQNFFYRVNYDSNTRAAIVQQLIDDNTQISFETRSQFMDDSFSLSRSLVIAETEAMEVTKYLNTEAQYNPWNVALKHIGYADKILQTYSWYSSFQSYILSLTQPVYTSLGWDYTTDETPQEQLLRQRVSTATCYLGDSECQTTAQALFDTYVADPDVNSVNPNSLPLVLCTGIGQGFDSDWVMAFNQYQARRTSPFNDERYAYLYGMACTTDDNWITTYLNYIVRGVEIYTRDQTTALNYLVMSNSGRSHVWQYFHNSWTSVPSTISKFTILRNIVSTWSTQADLNNFLDFVAIYPPSSDSQRELFVQMELIIRQNIDWVTANADDLQQWLADNAPGAASASRQSAGIAGGLTMPIELVSPDDGVFLP
jgi:aminopeptidase N